jgi:hypothetical protein
MHNETIVSGIRRLCIGSDIKLNRKSGYVCMYVCECIYISGNCADVYPDFSI